jgi:hypothetical protein
MINTFVGFLLTWSVDCDVKCEKIKKVSEISKCGTFTVEGSLLLFGSTATSYTSCDCLWYM